MPIEYMFCFICSGQCVKIISSLKKCGLFSSVFKKIIPNNTTLTFEEVGGVTLSMTQELLMISRQPSQNGLISTLKVFLLFSLPMFSIEMNQNVNL